jgi:phosphomannomutase/phosphoglucomutase
MDLVWHALPIPLPVVVLRFEADNESALKRIQEDFRRNILQAKPDAHLPF